MPLIPAIDEIKTIEQKCDEKNIQFSPLTVLDFFSVKGVWEENKISQTDTLELKSVMLDKLPELIKKFMETRRIEGQGLQAILVEKLSSIMEFIKEIDKKEQVILLNPLSQDLNALRQSMIFGGLENISFNINRKSSNLKIYEFGKTYSRLEADKYKEDRKLSLFVWGNEADENWNKSGHEIDFFFIKKQVEQILIRLGIQNFNAENQEAKVFEKGVNQLFENVKKNFKLPYPLMNIINGGAHANNGLKIQEFMIRPDKAKTFSEAMNICFLVIQSLKKLLISKNLSTSVGDEGGFAPMISKNEEALKLISNAIKKAGFVNGKDVSICLDVAANELFKNNIYAIDSKRYISYKDTILFYSKIIKRFKIKSIEDPFAENDWKSWSDLHKKEKNIQIVGDDLYVTNLQRLKKGFLYQSSNSILIKLNQIGTVSETLEVIRFAQNIGYTTIISHRSGDSEDTFISDLAVGTNSNQIKTGSLCRSERVAKFNQLLRIESGLIKSNNMAKLK